MARTAFVGCGFEFDVANLPPRSEWLGMKDGHKLPGEPSPQSLRRYCDPSQGVLVHRDPGSGRETRLVCPSFTSGGRVIYITRKAWIAFATARQTWRLKRKAP